MSGHQEELQLSAYLDKELNSRENARLESHLAGCPSCKQELFLLRRTKRALAAAPRRAVPPELIARLEENLSHPLPSRDSSWQDWLPRPALRMPLGAMAAVALVLGLWLGLKKDDPDRYVPLEPLLAAHSRYTAESLVPQGALISSNYALLAYSGDPKDLDAD